MKQIKLYTFLPFFFFLFTGCQIIEEGEVDYARTIENSGLNVKDLTNCNKELYDKSELTRAGVTRECYETLFRKYTKVPQIDSGDTISVHLMQAFNGAAFEWRNASEFFGGRGSNAEIVIIANVCEQGKAGCSMSYGPSSDKNGRVIFYSNGVKALQYLNFSYLPVYGPIKYEGGSLIIQLTIIELDDPSDQQKAMLNSLASAGQQLYPPASEVLTVLDSVGSAILSNSSDDILFRYSMTLVPASNSSNYPSPIVAEGNYAFIRKNTNKGLLEKEIFDKLFFDNSSGRLVEECSGKENKEPTNNNGESTSNVYDYAPCTLDLNTGKMFKDYRENTYLTFQVKSGFVEKTLDNIQTFQMLLSDLNQAADESASKAIDAISKMEVELSSQSIENNLLKSLSSLKNTVKDIPKDKFDLFSLQGFKLTELYDKEVKRFVANCTSTPNAKICERLISNEQLTNFQLEFRAFIKSINPTPSKSINTVIPIGPNILASASDVQDILNEGYKKFYNKSVYELFKGDLQIIRNLSKNIKAINNGGASSNYIAQRKSLLISKINDFLYDLASDHGNSVSHNCANVNVTVGDCYLYLSTAEKLQIVTDFNEYLTEIGVSTPSLDASSDSALKASLTTGNISSILSNITSKF